MLGILQELVPLHDIIDQAHVWLYVSYRITRPAVHCGMQEFHPI